MDLTCRKTKVRQPSRARFLMFEFFRVHEVDKLGACWHRRDGAAPTKGLWPKTTVASEAAHSNEDSLGPESEWGQCACAGGNIKKIMLLETGLVLFMNER